MKKFAKIPFNAAKFPFFYGWWIIGMGTLGVLMSTPGQTVGFSTFTDSLLEVLFISRDTLSLAYLCGTVLSSLILTKAGKLYDKYGVRPIAMIASIGLGCALMCMSQIDNIILFFAEEVKGASLFLIFPIILLGFLAVRFFGQGVLTLASRTMMMKWFDTRRGFALGFSSVFVALGFAMAPVLFEYLIQIYGWRSAWQFIGLVLIFIFPIIVFVFFRNDPEDVGLLPDGHSINKKERKNYFPVFKDFTLAEARLTFPFFIVTGIFAMQGLYITGFTFHVVSVFEEAGMSRMVAVSVFQPTAVVAVTGTLIFGWLADKTKVKRLAYLMCIGGCVGSLGMIFLGASALGFYALVFGNGVMIGLYGVIMSVAWPRFFGKANLGAIIGQSMTFVVFGSALGPYLMSVSFSQLGSYAVAGWICFGLFFLLMFGAFRMINPQSNK